MSSTTPSTAMRISGLAEALLSQSRRPTRGIGADVIALSAGEPDFETPEPIRRALHEAVDAGHTHYSPAFGEPELRAAIAEDLGGRALRSFAETEVLVTHGACGAISALMAAVLDPGDPVVIPAPGYPLYTDAALLAGAVPRPVPVRADWHLDVPAIAEAAAGARLIVLCNPCNPTGAVYPRHELDAVAEIAASEDLLVLADEAYDSIVYDGVEFTSALQVEGLQDRLLYAQTFSKTFAMTGFRVGYAAAPQVVVEAAGRLHFTHNGPVNSFVQRAALAALREPTDAPRRMCLEYQARRDLALEVLHGTPGVRVEPPEGAFYLWLRYDAPVPSLEVERRALEAGVAVVGGYRYGDAGEQCLRISFAASREDVREGLRRLRGVLESLEA